MKSLFERSFTPLSCAFALALMASTVQSASLPKDIEVDITMKNITSLVKEKNYIEVLPYFEQLEAMDVSLPESFYYHKIQSLDKMADTKKTLAQSQSYFTDYGKSGKYYNEVLEIYSRVSRREAKEKSIERELTGATTWMAGSSYKGKVIWGKSTEGGSVISWQCNGEICLLIGPQALGNDLSMASCQSLVTNIGKISYYKNTSGKAWIDKSSELAECNKVAR